MTGFLQRHFKDSQLTVIRTLKRNVLKPKRFFSVESVSKDNNNNMLAYKAPVCQRTSEVRTISWVIHTYILQYARILCAGTQLQNNRKV